MDLATVERILSIQVRKWAQSLYKKIYTTTIEGLAYALWEIGIYKILMNTTLEENKSNLNVSHKFYSVHEFIL